MTLLYKFLFFLVLLPMVADCTDIPNNALVRMSPHLNQERSFILIISLNGSLYSFDSASGEPLWSFSSGEPLVYSSNPHVIPAVDGKIFLHSESTNQLEMIATIREMVERSPYIGTDESIYVGSKETKTLQLLIDPVTGQLLSELDDYDDVEAKKLLIGRSDYTLRAIDPLTYNEKWKVSVAELSELNSLLSTEDFDLSHRSPLISHVDGIIHSYDLKTGLSIWSHNISSPIAALYSIKYSSTSQKLQVRAEPLTLTTSSHNPMLEGALSRLSPNSPLLLYVGISGSQPYGLVNPLLRLSSKPFSDGLIQDGSSISPQIENFSWGDGHKYHSGLDHEDSKSSSGSQIQVRAQDDMPDTLKYPHCLAGFHVVADSEKENLSFITPTIQPISLMRPSSTPLLINGQQQSSSPKIDTLPQFDYYNYLMWLVGMVSGATFLGLGFIKRSFLANSIGFLSKKQTASQKKREKAKEKQLEKQKEKENQKLKENEKSKNKPKPKDSEKPAPPQPQTQPKKNQKKNRNSAALNPIGSSDDLVVGNLIVTSTVLGRGSCGTMVFKGFFEGTPVAIKRMLRENIDVAQHEAKCLLASHEYPHIVRYYARETKEDFVYLALSLCTQTLSDFVTNDALRPHATRLAYEFMTGLSCLHRLNIVHRDLKPQNILLDSNLKLKISDMGLAKKLEVDQTSYTLTGSGLGSGTLGWRAPEVLQHHLYLLLKQADSTPLSTERLSKKIDIFTAGCVIYYILTGGNHPFGIPVDRERNILDGRSDLSHLNNYEAIDLVSRMINATPSLRPTAEEVLNHPFFWEDHKRLSFLKEASDRLEIEKPTADVVIELESLFVNLLGDTEWTSVLDSFLLDNLGKYRKYDGRSVRALVRLIRNKSHHYFDLPPEVQLALGPLPSGFLNYFILKFPRLLMGLYQFTLTHFRTEHIFHHYFLT